MPQTPPVPIHFWGLNIEKMTENQKILLFLNFKGISLFNFAENVMFRSLEIISIIDFMKNCDNGLPSTSKFILKNAIFGHFGDMLHLGW